MTQPPEITYSDELLADGTVHRRYSDGRSEWRSRGDGRIHWRDDRGDSGTDERLGRDLVKRVHADGRVGYGRDIGYGRTVWGQGRYVLVNRSSFPGRVGALIGALGLGAGIAAAHYAPELLSDDEEEELRRQEAERARSAGDGGGDGGGGDGFDDGGFDDGTDGRRDDDGFGSDGFGSAGDGGDGGDPQNDDGWDGDDFG
ncbi:hypothetical protein HUT16_03580 [Kitasatospora sp. NA04385]|uniref:hypothetical protein n=1 Tax=Kitasatospora sp. NA04385 TaxID=2742135 RepID=UPI00159270A5|nr:hypothetical protein [Kitasatospora sp. NA04385]QKW18266.1 hypothetical protein HUT16_03580 [Kitasatospora sp. NA04385]